MAADFGGGVVFILLWGSAGIALVVAAVGLPAVVWPSDALTSRIATAFGIIAAGGWIFSGATGFAQRTAMLNGNIAAAGSDIASERAVIEGLFIGVHVGGILFAFAALPWLAMVAVGAAKRRAMSRVAVAFLWVAAIGPIAGFVITGYPVRSSSLSFRHSRSSAHHCCDARAEPFVERMPRPPPLPSRPPLGDDDDMDLAVIIVTQVVNWPLAVLVARRAARGRAPARILGDRRRSWSAAPIAVWDPASALMFSRVSVAVANASLAMLFAVYPDGRFVPRWIVVPAASRSHCRWRTSPAGLRSRDSSGGRCTSPQHGVAHHRRSGPPLPLAVIR